MRSPRLLDVPAHPAITFVSDRLTTAGGRPELAGRLTVRDTTREVVLAVDDLNCPGSELRMQAATRIDRYTFGVTGYRGLASRRLDVRLDVVAVRMSHADVSDVRHLRERSGATVTVRPGGSAVMSS